jgi:hypothetical protein
MKYVFLVLGVLTLALWVSEGSTPSTQQTTWWLKSDRLN